jgi:hypothetical protein
MVWQWEDTIDRTSLQFSMRQLCQAKGQGKPSFHRNCLSGIGLNDGRLTLLSSRSVDERGDQLRRITYDATECNNSCNEELTLVSNRRPRFGEMDYCPLTAYRRLEVGLRTTAVPSSSEDGFGC